MGRVKDSDTPQAFDRLCVFAFFASLRETFFHYLRP